MDNESDNWYKEGYEAGLEECKFRKTAEIIKWKLISKQLYQAIVGDVDKQEAINNYMKEFL